MKSLFLLFSALLLNACAPTLQVAMPDKPMEINLNVKIDHKIKVEMNKDIDEAMDKNEEIF